MLELPDLPPEAGPNCFAFYRELRLMLDATRPSKISPTKTTVDFSDGFLEVWLVHSEDEDRVVGASMGESSGIVDLGFAHEHFDADESADASRPWTSVMVDFMAEALSGDIEVRTIFRGSAPIAVEHLRIEPDGSTVSLGRTGLLTPRRAMFWLPKTSVSDRVAFR